MDVIGVRQESRHDVARGVAVAATILVITALYQVTDASTLPSRVLQYLFFLPIVMAGLWFGWRGGVVAAAASAICYLPRLLLFWQERPSYSAEQYGEALDLLIVGSVFGLLAERERRKQIELAHTTEQLRRTYKELSESLDHLKRAERLSAVGQLTANLAHEIRNPLASIEGAAGLLEPSDLDEEMRAEFVTIIKKECRRLSRLLTDMLDYARPRAVEFRAASLPALVDSVVNLLHVMTRKANIRIRTEHADLPPVVCDDEQIKQVVMNLLMNAIQAMPDGGEILVRTAADGGRAAIEVHDQGVGVMAEDLDKLFSPFYTTKRDGTGLGLAVVQQIAVGHAGEIQVRPNLPAGAVFSLLLPLHGDGVRRVAS